MVFCTDMRRALYNIFVGRVQRRRGVKLFLRFQGTKFQTLQEELDTVICGGGLSRFWCP